MVLNAKKNRAGQLLSTLGVVVVALSLASGFSGCAVFSASVDSFKRSGLAESDRQDLLRKQVKDFHSILSFGRLDAATEVIEEDARSTLVPKLAKALKRDKFVEHSIEDIEFRDDSRVAMVTVNVRVFRNTDFLLKDRTIKERWQFHTGGTWRLSSYEQADYAG